MKKKRKVTFGHGPRTPRSEQLLLENVDLVPGRLLCTTLGRAQLAMIAALRSPDRTVHCHVLDAYQAEQSAQLSGDCGGRLEIVCAADFPEQEFDSVALPCGATGEAELARERIQQGYERLVEGGQFALTTDNRRDSFFDGELKKIFPKVVRTPSSQGVLYHGVKRGPLKRIRNFQAEYAFRDQGRLISVVSRPGVFSHRRIDTGSRALLEKVEIPPDAHVLEIGCGAGPITAAILMRSPGIRVDAVDSNARAIACTQATCVANGCEDRLRTFLSSEGKGGERGTIDLVVANPPYFSKYRIAELFLRSAVEALRDRGRAVFVTRQPEWFAERMGRHFRDITSEPHRGYHIVAGIRKH